MPLTRSIPAKPIFKTSFPAGLSPSHGPQFYRVRCLLTTALNTEREVSKPISLISHSDVRYRGILAGIDPANSTIQLSNGMSIPVVDNAFMGSLSVQYFPWGRSRESEQISLRVFAEEMKLSRMSMSVSSRVRERTTHVDHSVAFLLTIPFSVSLGSILTF